jgi:hypothetical protein
MEFCICKLHLGTVYDRARRYWIRYRDLRLLYGEIELLAKINFSSRDFSGLGISPSERRSCPTRAFRLISCYRVFSLNS